MNANHNPGRELRIALTDLRFMARHGVFEQERKVGNEFIVDLEVTIPEPQPNDDLAATVSYADLYEIVREEMAMPRQLLETVASTIADHILHDFPIVCKGSVSICKSTPPIPGITGSAKITLFF